MTAETGAAVNKNGFSAREVDVFGPVDGDPAEMDFQPAVATWSRTSDGQVGLELSGPFGAHHAVEPNLFKALMLVRAELQELKWQVVVNAARRDAWGPTEEHPCAVDEVRIYPDLAGPPTTEPLDALGPPTELGERGMLVTEQILWREEWAGLTRPGKMNWTEFDRSMREMSATRKQEAAEAAVPELPHSEPIFLAGPSPEDPTKQALQEGVAEWGRRAEGGVHLRVRAPGVQFDDHGADLLAALQNLRMESWRRRWEVLVNGSLRGAWHGTEQHPCGIAHVRFYPDLTGPPLPEQVDVLGTPPGDLRKAHWASVSQQTRWYHDWAGTTPPAWCQPKRKPRTEEQQPS
ncbi:MULTISPECIES: hypothetical protein [unclassified Saccharopolyspora]|uniref:hypothetical protein n=1 Tax=unclassified Saccharopolyspora TaxID=2646250 RepID=UPI001CD3F395|nr:MULTISPECIES: hypothetical protein [unclassified Saccharopolyspora]MCA1188888.1 hypothetical protein [Saccharopolyspora sp. 6T]MCA1195449.1 hypothetical protein [Saccharopolyspora sp. 6V]MCA1227299.1 hypothetical protein [Saccharopolyspora sp. 6M]MCA1279815.1 hypothetical protein [Saccharopolyspora sp. 7B]